MALNIKNSRVERLAAEVAKATGETKTEAIGRALDERKQRLALHAAPADHRAELLHFLAREVWPTIPKRHLGKGTKKSERENILGYGPEGV